jgi:ribosomal protein S18 acetylase RimI-like enzyme
MVVTRTRDRVSVRLAQAEDRNRLANLIHFSTWVHRHLDWRPPLDWIGYQPYLIAERDGQVLAAMACPPDPPEAAWMRLFAVTADFSISDAWDLFWPAVHEYLWGITIAAIPLQSWFSQQLNAAKFDQTHRVAMLTWENTSLPPESIVPDCLLRIMNFDDLESVKELDKVAFDPIWQQSMDMLKIAFHQAAVATVAEDDQGLIGYQISTAGSGGGHLARLAVHPRVQGEGVGYSLVRDMLVQFYRRGALKVSVNTQLDNHASLALYQKAGFHQTGEVYPVYERYLD